MDFNICNMVNTNPLMNDLDLSKLESIVMAFEGICYTHDKQAIMPIERALK